MEDEITPKSYGFNSLQGKYKPHEGSLIGRFEPGHQDTLNFGSLKVAIDVIREVGIEEIEKRITDLASEAKTRFTAEDLLEPAVQKRQIHSSIFNVKGDESLFNHLRGNNIICSQRGDGIRISFHYFNTSEDLEILMKVIRNFRK